MNAAQQAHEPDAAIAARCGRGLGKVAFGVARVSRSSRGAGYARTVILQKEINHDYYEIMAWGSCN